MEVDFVETSNSIKKVTHASKDFYIELFATEYDLKILSNKHIANKTIEAYAEIARTIEKLKTDYKQEYTILSHNLVTSHSLLQDALEQIVPEESLATAENHSVQIEIVKKLLDADKRNSAESVLVIAKRVVDLQAQIEGFKILSGNNKLDIGNHNIKKVLHNILYPFYEDFNKNNIEVRWHIKHEIKDENTIRTDYKVLNVALHHLLNNASKYVLPYSYIDICYNPEEKTLSFEMISIRIERDELKKIFDLRFRGRNVLDSEPGEGVGKYMVKKALDLLNADIIVEPNYSISQEGLNGTKYNFNKFVIKFGF